MAPVHFSASARAHLLARFEDLGRRGAHATTWARRAYAPMLIFDPELAEARAAIEAACPAHAIVFDVLFEAAAGTEVAWHVDYESLGPFDVPDAWAAVRDRHFLTVHVNLTPGGGALCTCAAPAALSWLHFRVIARWGIYGRAHRLLTALCRPWLAWAQRVCPAAPGCGNVFDNARLHRVLPGTARRVSYAVRLVRKDAVTVSRPALLRGLSRSPDCAAFARLLPRLPEDGAPVAASAVGWGGGGR